MRTDDPYLKRPRAKRGAPETITEELVDRIAEVVAAGNYLDTAARYCGVPTSTFYSWMKRAHEEKSGVYRYLLDELEKAQAKADVRDHAHIANASVRDWKAAAEHLRLRNSGRYRAARVELGGVNGQPIEVQGAVSAGLLELFTKLAGDDKEPDPPDDKGSGEPSENSG